MIADNRIIEAKYHDPKVGHVWPGDRKEGIHQYPCLLDLFKFGHNDVADSGVGQRMNVVWCSLFA